MTTTATYVFPGTEKQGLFIKDLVARKGVNIHDIPRPSTKAEVSAVIELLMAMPTPVAPLPEGTPEMGGTGDGTYLMDETLYRIHTGRNGKTWAYLVTEEGKRGEYFGHPRKLAGAKRLTVDEYTEEARKRNYTHCLICGRELTNAESIAAAVGPVCRSRF